METGPTLIDVCEGHLPSSKDGDLMCPTSVREAPIKAAEDPLAKDLDPIGYRLEQNYIYTGNRINRSINLGAR